MKICCTPRALARCTKIVRRAHVVCSMHSLRQDCIAMHHKVSNTCVAKGSREQGSLDEMIDCNAILLQDVVVLQAGSEASLSSPIPCKPVSIAVSKDRMHMPEQKHIRIVNPQSDAGGSQALRSKEEPIQHLPENPRPPANHLLQHRRPDHHWGGPSVFGCQSCLPELDEGERAYHSFPVVVASKLIPRRELVERDGQPPRSCKRRR